MSIPPTQHFFHPANVDAFRGTLRSGLEHLVEAVTAAAGPSRGTTPAEAARKLASVDLDSPVADIASVLGELSEVYLDEAIWFHDPGYAAHLNCPVVIPALLAELFISSVNSSLDTFDQSVGGTFIERRLIEWTGRRIGFAGGDGIFTSGGTQSNLQGLLLARERARKGLGIEAHRLRIFASVDGHFSVQKSAKLLGLPPDAVIGIEVGEDHRMDPLDLETQIRRCVVDGLVPMAVVATAGTTDFGAIDPLGQVAYIAERYGVWLHVDAAYGGGLLVSPTRRHLLDGIERADSVTVDYHKTWFQPVSASALLVREGDSLRAVRHHAAYLNPEDSTDPNQVDKSLQTTRRFDALKLWVTLRTMGPDQVGSCFDTVIDLAHEVHDALASDVDFEVAAEPMLSTLVFRYRPIGLTGEESSALTKRLRAALYAGGRGMVASTTVDGEDWLKFTLLNPMASLDQILAIVDALREFGDQLLSEDALQVAG